MCLKAVSPEGTGGNVPGLGSLITTAFYPPHLEFFNENRTEREGHTASVNPYPLPTSKPPPTFAIKSFATVGGRYGAPDMTALTDLRCSFFTCGEYVSWCTTGGTAGTIVALYLVEHR